MYFWVKKHEISSNYDHFSLFFHFFKNWNFQPWVRVPLLQWHLLPLKKTKINLWNQKTKNHQKLQIHDLKNAILHQNLPNFILHARFFNFFKVPLRGVFSSRCGIWISLLGIGTGGSEKLALPKKLKQKKMNYIKK